MPWVRIQTDIFSDEKFDDIDPWAIALWLAGLCYCNARLGDQPRAIDGKISARDLRKIVPDFPRMPVDQTVQALVDRKLWLPIDGGWEIANYSKYQKTRAELEHERELGRERAKRFYDRHVRGAPDPAPNGAPNERSNGNTNGVRSNLRGPSMVDLDELRSRRMA